MRVWILPLWKIIKQGKLKNKGGNEKDRHQAKETKDGWN